MDGIAGNSREFRQFDGTRSVTSRSVVLNDDRVPGIGWNWFRGQNWFRNVQHRGIGCILLKTGVQRSFWWKSSILATWRKKGHRFSLSAFLLKKIPDQNNIFTKLTPAFCRSLLKLHNFYWNFFWTRLYFSKKIDLFLVSNVTEYKCIKKILLE